MTYLEKAEDFTEAWEDYTQRFFESYPDDEEDAAEYERQMNMLPF